ncbi:MAG: hypothetical protein Q9166_004298 [cf. Caloplaca sp. 2 TL-2023]
MPNASERVPAYMEPAMPGFNHIRHELGHQLSPGARIYLPSDAGYSNATIRWSSATHIDFTAVVVPTTDRDVVAAVGQGVTLQIKYANRYHLPFLAVNRGHATSVDLNKLRYGINIYIRNLDSITISADEKSATLGGGVYADQLIKNLAVEGKTAATGACTCVGVVGAGLGGGLGRYQGLYGLIADNFLEMTVVTADGSIVTANDHQHADLYWAMRGAGHNFGIVTSFNISDVQVYSIYTDLVTTHPEFKGSVVQFEAYPVKKVQSVDRASTAYAHRDDNLLVSLLALYPPSALSDDIAPQYGHRMRNVFHAGYRPGRPLNTYVNYVYGDESLEQMYWYEGWRLQKLRALKIKWDPFGRFSWFHPIR